MSVPSLCLLMTLQLQNARFFLCIMSRGVFFLKLTLWVNVMPDVMYYYWQFFWGKWVFWFPKVFSL